MAGTLSLTQAKNRLAALWFTACAAIFLVVVVQSILGRYGENANKAFAWLLPTIMPTLSLMIGVLVAEALGHIAVHKSRINLFLYRLTFWISALYLVVVALTILLPPLAPPPHNPLKVMETSNVFLGPLQGLAASALGAFFYKPDSGV
jgi:hypothetical protein